tara:strand:+ start:384 stop:710 length:327 start_codon:yes stop_codon:yes gene_type:complete
MEYRDSKRLSLGKQKKLIFSIPSDLYFEGLEITSHDLKFEMLRFETIDVDITKAIKGNDESLEVIIKNYPVELEGVEIEISILGSVDAYYIDTDVLMDFSDEFIEKWT